MADTLMRLAGPSIMEKQFQTPAALYTPGVNERTAIKHAIIANSDAQDALAFLSINGMATRANRIINGLLVPAFRTIVQPIDAIVANADGDVVRARQTPAYLDIFANATLLQTPAAVASGTGNAGASATVATGSWTEVNDQLYLLAVAWRKAGGAGTISSFTDTHAGITWTLVDQVTSADGNSKLAVYCAVSTGTTAATTTVNFSVSQDASAAIVTSVAATGTFDNTTANGVDAVAGFLASEDRRSTTTPRLHPHSPTLGNRVMFISAAGAATTHTAPTGWTELDDIGTNHTLASAHAIGTATGQNVYAPTLLAGNGLSLGLGVEILPRVRPLAISLYGVEVT